MVAVTFKNYIQNLRDMENYLEKNCADLDYTAVKMPTGKGQDESGLFSFFILLQLVSEGYVL